MESRTIARYAEAMENDDLDTLKAMSSQSFEHKAPRLSDSMDDLKILDLPNGETNIVKVEDVSDDKKEVSVEVGESKKPLKYTLTRNPDSKKWVVDDITITQDHKGFSSSRLVTEQMDLLLTVREFLAACGQSDRQKVLSCATPELSKALDALPPAYLATLTKKVAGNPAKRQPRPQATLDKDVAAVTLPRTEGDLIITFKLVDGGWKVDDFAAESPGDNEHVYIKKNAAIVRAVSDFLDAYRARNKESLAKLCNTDFFEQSLAHSDLSTVELPGPESLGADAQVKVADPLADVVLRGKTETVKITLKKDSSDKPKANRSFLVQDVTIYETDGARVKRLSALFTAHAMMNIFSDALANRDLPMLKQTSTVDFTRRVWSKLNADS